MNLVTVTRGFFLLTTAAGILSKLVPTLRERYVDYGARTIDTRKDLVTGKPLGAPRKNFLDRIVTYPVPHVFFLHYYTLSLASSIFWGVQILTQGAILKAVVGEPRSGQDSSSMDMDQVVFVWALMAVQGGRRYWETAELMKPSASTMPLSIYLLGLAYYFFVNIAIWVEGSGAILERTSILESLSIAKVPSLRTLIFFPIFLCASGIQNDCHRYLASLKKYTLPTHPIFQRIVCPHYTMECVIYLSIAVMATPPGKWINVTMLTVVAFVINNLAVVADTTKQWQIQKFGAEKVSSRWRMIPWIW